MTSYDFIPNDGAAIHKDVIRELDKYPEDRTEKDIDLNSATAIRSHLKDFLSAVASRGKPVADIEQGYISSASCILANISMQFGRALEWDTANGRVANDEEANRLLRRPYRAPWIHPEAEKV